MNKFLEFFNINKSAMSPTEIHQDMQENLRYGIDNLLILAAAIMIASIGLNTNSIPVIIGAMLISPIMGPLLTLSYAISTSNNKLLNRSLKMLAIYITVAISISTIYFHFSFITTPTSELIARTNPNVFDFLIAFFGGLAGIIGSTRKTKTNVIPGVAIATALMPPLCTVGYGIANMNVTFIYNALILFITNGFLIVITAISVLKVMKLYRRKEIDETETGKIRRIILFTFILILIPVALNTFKTVNRDYIYSDFTIYIDTNINDENTIITSSSIDYNTNTIFIQSTSDLTQSDKDLIKNYQNSHNALKDFNIIIEYQNIEYI